MRSRWAAAATLLLFLCACQAGGDAVDAPPTALASPAVPTTGAASAGPSVPPAPNVGTPSTREAEVRTAIGLMAEETGYPEESVRVVRVEDVVWPSRALGCPAWSEGQAAESVPGYRIILGYREVELHYHGADGEDPRRCDFLDF